MLDTQKTDLPKTFAVDDVEPAKETLWSEPLADHVAKRFKRAVLFLEQAQRPVINSKAGRFTSERKAGMLQRGMTAAMVERALQNAVSRTHPLIEAVGKAFSDHRPLTLSPDAIWLTIQQGFAHHLLENADALRGRLVKHKGKRDLVENISEMSSAEFERAIGGFSLQIREATDPVLHETLVCDFSTTTPAIRTASEIVLMDCYASYFAYTMRCVCGIPKVTLSGSVVDWERIRARIEVLETFGLEWWVGRVRPIIDELIKTAAGRPDLSFWQAIYKPKRAYGTLAVTGWIADLFPYLGDGPKRRRSHVFEHARKGWAVTVEHGVQTGFMNAEPGVEKGVATGSFPCGLASVPAKLSFSNGGTRAVDLVGGFLGVEQDARDMSLAPLIGWSVAEPAPQKPIYI